MNKIIRDCRNVRKFQRKVILNGKIYNSIKSFKIQQKQKEEINDLKYLLKKNEKELFNLQSQWVEEDEK